MAVFEQLNWTDFDAWAILAGRGVVVLESGEREKSHRWLERHRYERVCLDFSSGISSAVKQLNNLLNWQAEFGYEMNAESRKLDALRDGFEFSVPVDGGLVLELQEFELAWRENQHWASGLLAISSEFSIQQLALGKRFFTMVEVGSKTSPILGQQFESLSLGYLFRFPNESA